MNGMKSTFIKYFTSLMFLCMLLVSSLPVQAQQIVVGDHVEAQLVAETETLVPGQPLWVALRLKHQDNWHTYWTNPGDAGLPTEISWNLPVGVSAGEIVWPTPERIELPADLVDFGYENEIFLLTLLTIPETFDLPSLDLTAKASWLECAEGICIPSYADLALSVPVGVAGGEIESAATPAESVELKINEQWRAGFASTRASFPREDIVLDSMFSIANGEINLLIQATESIFENAEELAFFPDQHRILDYNAEQKITSQLSSLQLSQLHHSRVLRAAPERVGGLLLVTNTQGQQTVYQIDAEPDGISLAALEGMMPSGINTAPAMNIFVVLVFAMLGGLILNLMPCVFPVLSLKVMHLVASSDSSIVQQRLHGLAYAGGVIIAFFFLASVLLMLQAGGELIGWGFHMQTPWFIGALVYLFFVMGLSMSGVVEFGTGIMGVGSKLTEEEGYMGSFFTGVLAAVVASPCTAPFMGAALGFALTQSAAVALAVFVALGFGMALPFLLLSFIPALARLMPKPGKWMLTFKKVLAWPLYATVLWLLWVLRQQTSITAVALVLGSCVLLALAAYLYQGRWERSGGWRYGSAAIVLLCLLVALGVLRSPVMKTQLQTIDADLALEEGYEVYSAARLNELRTNGTPVFVNMTAAWCITCLVNERVALGSDVFKAALVDNNVVYLKGDWTNNNPEITEVLKRYQTSGVPLYLMFPADAGSPAEVLPQILTESIMLDALTRI